MDNIQRVCIENRIRELEYKLSNYSRQVADAEELLREYKAMLAQAGGKHVG